MLLQVLGGLILANAGCSVAFASFHSHTQINIELFVGVVLVLLGTLKGLFSDAPPDVEIRDGKWVVVEPSKKRTQLAMKLGHPLREIDLTTANSCVDVHEYLYHNGNRPPLKQLAEQYKKFKEAL